MGQAQQMDQEQVLEAARLLIQDSLLRSDGGQSTVLCVAGPPRSGKTTFASQTLLLGLKHFGDGGARLVVSGRHAAAFLSKKIIEEIGVSGQTRPVGTLQALAFQLVSWASQQRTDQVFPKLLNGAEQDALLRDVLASHMLHMQAGDTCSTCILLQDYFASKTSWSAIVSKSQAMGLRNIEQIDDNFIAQLRDMLARMIELGLKQQDQGELVKALDQQSLELDIRDRLKLQWRLAFALWEEYVEQITEAYPGEYRLDSSMLMVKGRQVVEAEHDIILPQLLIVDDWQDLTIAGMSFIQALHERGVRLVLVGNPDESVQSFRGSYPEFLAARVGEFATAVNDGQVEEHVHSAFLPFAVGRLGAVCLTLPYKPIVTPIKSQSHQAENMMTFKNTPASYADMLAARLSLSILNEDVEFQSQALFDRPGKMPHWPSAMPIVSLDASDALLSDGSVTTRLFHTPDQEADDLIWQIKHEFLEGNWDWNDMAVIAHDNSTVHAIGQKLRSEGVPVRFSSIDKPLKDDSSVQGIFALIQLAQARNQQERLFEGKSAAYQAQWVRDRLITLLSSPLIEAVLPATGGYRPVRLERIDTVFSMFTSLVGIANSTEDEAQFAEKHKAIEHLEEIQAAWAAYVSLCQYESKQAQVMSGIEIDDSLIGDPNLMGLTDTQLTINSLYFMLVCLPENNSGRDSLTKHQELQKNLLSLADSITQSRLKDSDLQALEHALVMVDKCAQGLQALDSSEPAFALWEAWQAADKADRWQMQSLEASQEGEQANDRLDSIMRLFQFAQSSQTFEGIDDFIVQVQGMQIEADSLAHIGPVEHAVTLTTPAGAAASVASWPLVWLPALQEGIWPNLSARDTLFGAEELSDLMLYGMIRNNEAGFQGGHDFRLKNTLYAEEKGFLMAVTRARKELRLSAVWNDDTVPSEFLYGFLPELCPRVTDMSQANFAQVGSSGAVSRFSGLEVGARGIVAAARSILVQYVMQEDGSDQIRVGDAVTAEEAADAVSTLRYLENHGVNEASPSNWPFVYLEPTSNGELSDIEGSSRVSAKDPVASSNKVSLSPSAVDDIWACPLEWAMSRQFAGPKAGSVAISFGSLIHQVAQEAADQGLDKVNREVAPEDQVGRVQLIASTTDHMMEIYRNLRQNYPEFSTPKDAYDKRAKEAQVRQVLGNVASYFVMSSYVDYGHESNQPIEVGTLQNSWQEKAFKAKFTPTDFMILWNKTYPEFPLDEEEFFALAAGLVGGFPRVLRPDTDIVLSGRIDRIEDREINGRVYTRLVDYKTGKKGHTGPEVFNDLQLVCYQLGLAFPAKGEGSSPSSRESSRSLAGNPVSQAVLFDVSAKPTPAYVRGPENAYQPALFADGMLNKVYSPRYYYKTVDKISKLPPLQTQPPQGVSQKVWDFVVKEQSTNQSIWALTMISRVLFAAGVKLSAGFEDAVFDADRCQKKSRNGQCVAWERLAGSVMEDRR